MAGPSTPSIFAWHAPLLNGVRTRRKVTLLAGGIGVTPLRALLEELEQGPGDVTLVYRAHSADDLVLDPSHVSLAKETKPIVIVPIPGLHLGVLPALSFARAENSFYRLRSDA